jgi:hypothetical protein
MSDQTSVAATPTIRQLLLRVVAVAALAAPAAGCLGPQASTGGPMAAMASATPSATPVSFAPASGSATVAFESIDGPPPQVFDRFVRVLDAESQTRNVAIVSRGAAAGYRIRSYLSAQIRGGRTVIAWVWDVYDGSQQRALRLSGEEAAGKTAGRDAWAAADEALLRRIAQSGLISLSGLVNGTAPPELPEPPARGPAIASLSPAAAEAAPETTAALGFSAH